MSEPSMDIADYLEKSAQPTAEELKQCAGAEMRSWNCTWPFDAPKEKAGTA